MRYRHRHNGKSFGENLAPLRGLVRASVGKRWDAFYSELCRSFDMRSQLSRHILEHLESFCERHLFIKDGELWLDSVYAHGKRPLKGSSVEFYVDPRDGVIKRNAERKTRKQCYREERERLAAEEALVFKKLDDNTVLRKIEGIWYLFELKALPVGEYVSEKPANQDTFRVYGGKRLALREKRWEELSDFEKKFFGRLRFKGETAIDAFTLESVFRSSDWTWNQFQATRSLPPELKGKYHASKKTASKRDLKRAGLA